MKERLFKLTHSSEEYFGTAIDFDHKRGVMLVVLRYVQTSTRANEAFDYALEAYEEQGYRRMLIDHRKADWPEEMDDMEARFQRQAVALPKSQVVLLCRDVNHPAVVLGKRVFNRHGHVLEACENEEQALAAFESASYLASSSRVSRGSN